MSRLVFSQLALADLEQTLEYISRDKPTAALEFVSLLKAKCQLLSEFPELGMKRDDLAPGIHVFAAAGYGIYYRRLDDLIRIERVLHGARDPGAQL